MSVGKKCVLPGQQAEQGILLLLDPLLMWHDQGDCAWAVVVCLVLPAIAAIRQLAVRRGMLLLLALLAVCKAQWSAGDQRQDSSSSSSSSV